MGVDTTKNSDLKHESELEAVWIKADWKSTEGPDEQKKAIKLNHTMMTNEQKQEKLDFLQLMGEQAETRLIFN